MSGCISDFQALFPVKHRDECFDIDHLKPQVLISRENVLGVEEAAKNLNTVYINTATY